MGSVIGSIFSSQTSCKTKSLLKLKVNVVMHHLNPCPFWPSLGSMFVRSCEYGFEVYLPQPSFLCHRTRYLKDTNEKTGRSFNSSTNKLVVECNNLWHAFHRRILELSVRAYFLVGCMWSIVQHFQSSIDESFRNKLVSVFYHSIWFIRLQWWNT